MIRHYLVCLPYWIFVDYIFVRLSLTYLPANNLRRISTMYVRGYLQGSENGRVVTIVPKGQSRIDKLATLGTKDTQDEDKQNINTQHNMWWTPLCANKHK